MLKAVASTNKGPLVILGLSHGNLDRLRKGLPIKIDMAELGGEGHIVIFSGQTEAAMAAEMAELIGPTTKVHGMKQ